MEKVRIGFIGVGGMGTAHVRNLLRIEGAELCAVCDIVEWKVERVQADVCGGDERGKTCCHPQCDL